MIMRCPIDQRELVEPQPARRILSCAECKGILFSDEKLVQVVRNNGLDLMKITKEPEREVDCPGCSVPMRVFDIDSVEIDICVKCALVWMDEGEFPKTRAFLDQDARARARVTERTSGFDTGTTDLLFPGTQTDAWDKAEIIGTMLDILFRAFLRRW